MVQQRVAVFAAGGKTGQSVATGLVTRGVDVVTLGRDWSTERLTGCRAAYLIAPNLHPDEPGYVGSALASLTAAGVRRVVYHSVASPYLPRMPHHLGKAAAEDLVRRSGLRWTILQPGAYLQNLSLSGPGPVRVPYRVDAPFGFLDLADLAGAAATTLLDDGHDGATYELATVASTVREVAYAAGLTAEQVGFSPSGGFSERENAWLTAMFDYYDSYGLPVGTKTLRMLLNR